jgi:hypothetical protein
MGFIHTTLAKNIVLKHRHRHCGFTKSIPLSLKKPSPVCNWSFKTGRFHLYLVQFFGSLVTYTTQSALCTVKMLQVSIRAIKISLFLFEC